MPKSEFPKPDGPLPPAPKRPWGTGSIEVRGRGYMARWRENGKQRHKLFGTIAEAEQHLAAAYPPRAGSRPVETARLRGLLSDWRVTASWLDYENVPGVPPPEEDEGARVARLIREAQAQALKACATSLEDLLDG